MKSYFSTNRVLAYTISCVALTALFFACKKENNSDAAGSDQNDNRTAVVATHETQVNGIYGDIYSSVSMVSTNEGLDSAHARKADNSMALVSCPSTLLDITSPLTWPKTVTIDFGTSCSDNMGTIRSGKLVATFSAPLFAPNSSVKVVLNNYKVNGIPVEGTVTFSNVSYKSPNGIQYTTAVNGGLVKLNDSTTVAYTSIKNVKQIAGGATPLNPSDDVFSVDGTATITYKDSSVANISTPTPLEKAFSCKWISKGVLKIEYNKVIATIDYGNGTCDSIATIKIGDKQKDIVIR
ncbi:hypothetical protein [Chitinophaga vietnamensis]|uniref:hypothetical protein n=1 Tax=Chitinophaga vietnamensis TaxID=2593957 RepID=UPI00117895E8|nr:hypothetical protein [Chitinophaga vietnamensis]